ncbi:MAG: ABC transporter substrate binding protein, partial [Pseudomonadota bacterium]
MHRSGNSEFLQAGGVFRKTGGPAWRQGVALLAMVWLSGCSMFGPSDPSAHDRANSLVILLSDESPAYRRVAQEVASRAGRPVVNFRLDGTLASQEDVIRRLQRSTYSTVVAIGLPAARSARRLTGKRVVFCQVSSHEEESLVSPLMKGVSAVPPVREQFRAWRALNPKLRTVGVITGPQQRALLAEARQSARENGLVLIAVEVKSDRETLYAFQRLSPRVQGLWLVPDNRVLSNSVLHDLMAYAVKEGKQV